MSQESQKIAVLRDRLALIESTQINEGPLDGVKSAWNAGKNLVKNFKGGLGGDAARTAKGTYAPQASAAGMANRGGKVVAANPVKTAAATGAVGAGVTAAAMSGGGAATKPADAAGAPAGATTPGAAATAAGGALTPEEQKELDKLAQSYGDSEDPEIMALLKQYSDFKNAALNGPKNAGNPELDAIKKNAGIPASANYGNAGEAEAQAKMAAGAATKPAAPAAGGTTTTQSNQSVQGTMTMGKPDGPITFNGKVVQPGAPEYAAASDALIKAQSASQKRFAPKAGDAPAAPAAPGAPGAPGATSSDWAGKK
jgi:hypothetical protein